MKGQYTISIIFICFCLAAPYRGRAQMISTVAGNGVQGLTGNGGPADSAEIDFPKGIAVDRAGNLYIADYVRSVVRKVDTAGIISVFAGTGAYGYGGDNGPADSAKLYAPEGVAVDTAGNVYIADNNNNVVRKVNTAGIITTIAGNASGHAGYVGDGHPADSALLNNPMAVAVDLAGNIYISDNGNNVIRKVNPAGIISTYAGRDTVSGYTGDNGPADSATLSSPQGIAVDAAGDLYIADNYNNVIRKVNTAGIITTFAGNRTITGTTNGDGGPADSAYFAGPYGVAVDSVGNVYIADVDDNSIRIVNTSDTINTFAGGNMPAGFGGDGGPATAAKLAYPSGVATDPQGNVYISDSQNYRVRKVVPAVTTGIDKLSGNNFTLKVYPNPAKQELQVACDGPASNFRITDMTGRVLLSQQWVPSHVLKIEDLACGIYVLGLYDQSGNVLAITKFVKE